MHIPRSAVAIAMITVAAVLSACGGGNSDDTTLADPAHACAALVGFVIPAARIALPTTGASVTSAALQVASGTGLAAKPEHCKVLAQVAPIDPGAQPTPFARAFHSWEGTTPSRWRDQSTH